MIPREEHLKQVSRFHDILKKIDDEIEAQGDNASLELLSKFFYLTSKVWPFVDDRIEEIKYKLDNFEADQQHSKTSIKEKPNQDIHNQMVKMLEKISTFLAMSLEVEEAQLSLEIDSLLEEVKNLKVNK
jgi:hypothetical protein